MKKRVRVISLILSIVMILGMLPVGVFAAGAGMNNFKKQKSYDPNTFTDVKSEDWFYENVKSVYELGLMVGRSDGRFGKNDNITIAETLTIAARLNSIYYTGSADFQQGTPWYQVYADYCERNRIADPSKYNLNDTATRADFAMIFASALPKEALKSINSIADNALPDVKNTDYFGEAVYKLYRAGILVGNDDIGAFSPFTNITRCQIAAIVSRMADISLRITPRRWAEHTVVFNLNYDGMRLASQKVSDGETVKCPAEPTRTGYIFTGWYTASVNGELFDFGTKINSDLTLYAHWIEEESKSLVTDAYASNQNYIPKINIDSLDVAEINAEIWNLLYENAAKWFLDGDSRKIQYTWNVNGDVLSLVTEYEPGYGSASIYGVYNVSISSGKALSNSEVLSSVGVSEAAYRDAAKRALGSYYWVPVISYWDETYKEEMINRPEEIRGIQKAFANTISEENITQARPYLGKYAELFIIGTLYDALPTENDWRISLKPYLSDPGKTYTTNPDYIRFISK